MKRRIVYIPMLKNSFTLVKKIVIPVMLICLMAIIVFRWRGQSYAQITLVHEPQSGIAAMIARLKNDGMQFPEYGIIHGQTPLNYSVQKDVLSKGEVFNLNDGTVSMMAAGINQTLALRLPDPLNKYNSVKLELTQVDIVAEGFRVTTASSNGQPIEFQSGKHYRGIVKGVPGSIAAISVFKDEVAGIYSTPEGGNVVIGKLGGENQGNLHITYPSTDLKIDRLHRNETKDEVVNPKAEEISAMQTTASGGSVKVYIEVDHDIFQSRGSVEDSINWVQAIFNQSATLFANDGISVKLSEMFVWDRMSPYTAETSDGMLSQFQTTRNSFNGDLGQLISMRVAGGQAASLDGLCNSDIDKRQSYSYVKNNYKKVPVYSLLAENITEELGYLMGSPQTNNAGDNFSVGLNAQSAALMRNRVNSASCINDSASINAFGPDCVSSINPRSASFGMNEDNDNTIAVYAEPDCQWTATSSARWIHLYSDTQYGNGSIFYIVETNIWGKSRTGYITVGGHLFTITQSGYNTILIKNGGFESGISPWKLWSAAFRSTGAVPRSGSAYAIIADGNNESGSIYQDIYIPANTSPFLSFGLSITSEEPVSAEAHDHIYIQVRNTSNQVLEQLDHFNNHGYGNGAYILWGEHELGQYAGQTIRITFLARNNGSYPTKFRVDDVFIGW